jgi:phage/plasmid-like protein (TIGR03299 family)
MSQETREWLNSGKVKVGFCDKRPLPWWYDEDLANPNVKSIYDGAVPLLDIRRDITKPLTMLEGESWAKFVIDGKDVWVQDTDQKAIGRPSGFVEGESDLPTILGRHSDSYVVHDYETDLMGAVERVLEAQSGSVDIGSAIALKNGAQFFVQFEMPENVISTKVGEKVRPSIFACTSVDGTLASNVGAVYQRIVCDNTGRAAINEAQRSGLFFTARHTTNSLTALVEMRDKLGITLADLGNDLIAEIEALCEVKFEDNDFEKALDIHDGGKASLTDKDGNRKEKGALTIAEKRRDTYKTLWKKDARVSPWKNTLWGWLQADNTYKTHFATVRGQERAMRNYEGLVLGKWGDVEDEAMATAKKVMGSRLTLTNRVR